MAILLVVVAALALYYPLGMAWVHTIDDDPAFATNAGPQKGSKSVAAAAALIERETDVHRWTANDPFFLPSAALDNMPHFQQGIVGALSRFAIEMSDQIGRTRGSSEVDADLDKAAGLLKYAGDIWVFDFSTSLAPTATSEAQYRAARRALMRYNDRLASGEAVFEARADNLQATLERITTDLGSASAIAERHIESEGGLLIDLKVDDIFYATKGRLYAYYVLLREMGTDFSGVIAEKEMQAAWEQMLDSLHDAAMLQPFVVASGDPDGQVVPSHLAAQGFYLLRARTQMKEVSNILLK